MIKLADKKHCTGCEACVSACKKTAITMHEAKDGFLYPIIDASRCVNCHVCERSCPIINGIRPEVSKSKAFATFSKDEHVRSSGSSGGLFFEIASEFINNGGIVFGAVFDKDYMGVHHTFAKTIDELMPMRGSKYIQSKVEDSYSLVKDFLEQGKNVFFTGTPCQIGGLRAFLGKDYDNLFLQDIICHGIPSSKFWRKYLKQRNTEFNSLPRTVNFREKSTGWKKYSVCIDYLNGKKYKNKVTDDPYMRAFVRDVSLRKSCYNCSFKGIDRFSDITLADFWGCENLIPELSDDKGVSLVIIHSEKGKKIFNSLNNVYKQEVELEKAIESNPSIKYSVSKNPNRTYFIKHYDKVSDIAGFMDNCSKRQTLKTRVIAYKNAILKRLFK